MVGEWERGKSRIKNVEGEQFESIDLRLVVTLDPIVYPIPSNSGIRRSGRRAGK